MSRIYFAGPSSEAETCARMIVGRGTKDFWFRGCLHVAPDKLLPALAALKGTR